MGLGPRTCRRWETQDRGPRTPDLEPTGALPEDLGHRNLLKPAPDTPCRCRRGVSPASGKSRCAGAWSGWALGSGKRPRSDQRMWRWPNLASCRHSSRRHRATTCERLKGQGVFEISMKSHCKPRPETLWLVLGLLWDFSCKFQRPRTKFQTHSYIGLGTSPQP